MGRQNWLGGSCPLRVVPVVFNRGAGIRTRDLLLPKQARYQAALRPVSGMERQWARRDSNPQPSDP